MHMLRSHFGSSREPQGLVSDLLPNSRMAPKPVVGRKRQRKPVVADTEKQGRLSFAESLLQEDVEKLKKSEESLEQTPESSTSSTSSDSDAESVPSPATPVPIETEHPTTTTEPLHPFSNAVRVRHSDGEYHQIDLCGDDEFEGQPEDNQWQRKYQRRDAIGTRAWSSASWGDDSAWWSSHDKWHRASSSASWGDDSARWSWQGSAEAHN